VLLEWEDMFPYEGVLEVARNANAYSKEDIRNILRWAQEANLDIIPLVQTFGHLEWVLKLEQFAKFRQVDKYPQVTAIILFIQKY
jgi:hexosaminidase